jgi:membrane protein
MKLKVYHRYFRKRVNKKLDTIMIPAGKGISLFTVVSYFKAAIAEGSLNTRAAAISFKFFIAIFPGIIFLFTIIPLVPIPNFQSNLMLMLQEMIPEMLYPLLENTINDIVSRRHTGLLSIGFLGVLWFSSNSFISIISSFNQSINIEETRSPMQQRVLSIIMMMASTLLVVLAILVMVVGQDTLDWLVQEGYLRGSNMLRIIPLARWFLLGTIIYLMISGIYYYAPAKNTGFRFFSVGSLITTLSFMLIAWGFGYFVVYFSAHNALYGSVGTLLLTLLYIHYNAIILLVGFELNASIHKARKNCAIG